MTNTEMDKWIKQHDANLQLCTSYFSHTHNMYTSCSFNKSLKNFTKVYVNNETTTHEGIIEKLVCERCLTILQDAISVAIFFSQRKS
jgi:hypothetical protein